MKMYRWFIFDNGGKTYCTAPDRNAAQKLLGPWGSVYCAGPA